MKNDLKLNISVAYVLMLIILVIMGIGIGYLWVSGSIYEGIIASLVGLSFWAIKLIITEQFKKIDKKVDQQHQILLQGIQAGYDFKQTVMQNMYEITNELWNRSIWIAMNWNSLWPGNDGDLDLRKEFDAKFKEYYEFMSSNSINIPSQIFTAAEELVQGIGTYKMGRMRRDDKANDDETRKEGSINMSEGTRLIKSSMENLFLVIRKDFELDQLPSEVLKIPVPKESEDNNDGTE